MTSLLILGFAYGAIADDVSHFAGDNQTLKDLFAAGGGSDLTDAYFGTAMLTLALIGCCYPLQTIQRLRGEETTLHTETVLATPTSRLRWLSGHLAVSGGGSLIVMTAAGLGVGVPYAVATHDAHHVPVLLGAALVYLPAIWVLVGVSVALHGLAPWALTASWVALVGCFMVELLGQALKLPHWVVQLSPFQHIPKLPAATLSVAPLAAQTAIAVVLLAIGALAFRHRDLG
jgi:ABC-2 type transport system permease protein